MPGLPAHWRRLYAHVHAFDLACPNCGAMQVAYRTITKGYDKRTAIWRCPQCRRQWYVGVLFWPAKGRSQPPEDHVPSPGEAAALRAQWSAVTTTPLPTSPHARHSFERIRPRVNLACTCAQPCPVHAPPSDPTPEEAPDDD